MINDIYKNRNYAGCFNAALSTYSTNITKIFRATWIYALVFSLISGAGAFTPVWASFSASEHGYAAVTLVVCAVLGIVSIIVDARLKAGVVSMLNGDTVKANMAKFIKISILSIVLVAIVAVIMCMATYGMTLFDFVKNLSFSTGCILMASVNVCILILAVVFMSPFIYSVSKYIFVPGLKFKSLFGRNYHIGLHKLGFLFTTAILLGLFCSIICLVLCIPGLLSNLASSIDSYGVAQGDASGLPGYFAWLNFMSTALLAFIMQYVVLWAVFVFFYAYGNVETYATDSNTTIAATATTDLEQTK